MKNTILLLALALAAVTPAFAAEEEPAAPSLFSSFPIRFYGYVKLDAVWDSSRLVPGNYVLYAASEATAEDDGELNVTANQTRIGFSIAGPTVDGIRTGGRLEFDFYGGGAENKAIPMLRHAFLTATWKAHDLELLAGQTWDVISAFYLPTINYTAGMAVGDYGYRRPQIRLTKGFALSEKTRLEAQIAASRTIGDGPAVNPNTKGDTGEDSGLPTFQGRLALKTKAWFAGRPAVLAVYGHWGREEFDTAADDQHKEFDSWSLGTEFSFPLHRMVVIKGSLYTGANLDTYVGGIAQGVNTTTLDEIASTGGFIFACVTPSDSHEVNVGWGVDDPDNGDIKADGTGRAHNQIVFGNLWWRLTRDLRLGGELSYWATEYKNARSGTAMRVHLSVQFFF